MSRSLAQVAVKIGPVQRSKFVIGALPLVIASLQWGCRAKIDVQTKSGGPPITEAPVPVATKQTTGVLQDPATALLPVKQVYQSREVVRIRVSQAMIGSSSSLSLLNVTGISPENEGNAPVILDQVSVPATLGLTSDEYGNTLGALDLNGSRSVTLTRDSEGVVISIMPTNSDIRKMFKYGVNKLKIIVIDPIEDRFTYATITLKDFNVLGPAMAHFEGPNAGPVAKAADGSQFQGWVNMVSPPVVTVKEGNAIKGSLANGVFNMIQ
jgi:hypothetical protein